MLCRFSEAPDMPGQPTPANGDKPYLRILRRLPDGRIVDVQDDYDPSDFAGRIPSIGDEILVPGVLEGLDRSDPESRTFWKVLYRVFNPRDLGSVCVALVVEERAACDQDVALLPNL